jgi:hypothetical protein
MPYRTNLTENCINSFNGKCNKSHDAINGVSVTNLYSDFSLFIFPVRFLLDNQEKKKNFKTMTGDPKYKI